MKLIKSTANLQLWRFGWHLLFAILVLVAVATVIAGAIVAHASPEGSRTALGLWTIGAVSFALAVLSCFFAILLLTRENVKSIKENAEKLDNTVEMVTRNRNLLGQISQGVRLSDAAKEIAFRDTDRINQIINHVDKLCEQSHWSQATAVIERLIRNFPHSEKAKAMPSRLQRQKSKRKRELLAAWDNAVKRQQTNESLEILKELDQYLTPSEGLALQESASSVFRTKLHNLGVQFSLAVSEKLWQKALRTGQQIIRDFPNSRMAHEIRSKMDILHERAKTSENDLL